MLITAAARQWTVTRGWDKCALAPSAPPTVIQMKIITLQRPLTSLSLLTRCKNPGRRKHNGRQRKDYSTLQAASSVFLCRMLSFGSWDSEEKQTEITEHVSWIQGVKMRWKSSLMSILQWQIYNCCCLTEVGTRAPRLSYWLNSVAPYFPGHFLLACATYFSIYVALVVRTRCSKQNNVIIFNIIQVRIWSVSNTAGFISFVRIFSWER